MVSVNISALNHSIQVDYIYYILIIFLKLQHFSAETENPYVLLNLYIYIFVSSLVFLNDVMVTK